MLSLVKHFRREDCHSGHLLPPDVYFLVLKQKHPEIQVASKFLGTGEVSYLNHYPFPLQDLWVKPTLWKATDVNFHGVTISSQIDASPSVWLRTTSLAQNH